MFRGAAVPFLVCLAVVSVNHGLASPPFPYNLTQHELMMSIIVNQIAIIKGMNDSTHLASHGGELNQLREDMEEEQQAINEEVVKGMNELNHTLQNEIEQLTETVETKVMNEIETIDRNIQTGLRELDEQMENKLNNRIEALSRNMQTSLREQMEDEIDELAKINQKIQTDMAEMNEERMNDTQRITKLEAAHKRPDWNDLYVHHNDTYVSLCDGHKVLYGGDGYLEAAESSSKQYANNMDCSWTVTLPEGSRPVFRWLYFDIQKCTAKCNCDYLYIYDMDHNLAYKQCGDNPPNTSFFTIMNNKFKVRFHSDGSVTRKGFRLKYRGVEMN